MVKSTFNCVIYTLTQPQVANQQKKTILNAVKGDFDQRTACEVSYGEFGDMYEYRNKS